MHSCPLSKVDQPFQKIVVNSYYFFYLKKALCQSFCDMPQLALVSTGQHQFALVSTGQHWLALVSTSQHQLALVSTIQHQLEQKRKEYYISSANKNTILYVTIIQSTNTIWIVSQIIMYIFLKEFVNSKRRRGQPGQGLGTLGPCFHSGPCPVQTKE